MKTVRVGIIGSGFAANLHLEAYQKVSGVDVQICAVATIAPDAREFAARWGIAEVYADYHEMIAREDLDVIDIITPPYMHKTCIEDVLKAGKHVICEKPLLGYFGEPDDEAPIGLRVSRTKMYESVCRQIDELSALVRQSGKQFFYAENWVYSPVVQKAAEAICIKKARTVMIKAEESHSGSHADHSARWAMNGGGALIRQGCHPLAAVLYLKQREASALGLSVKPVSLLCDVGAAMMNMEEEQRGGLDARPVDVEDFAALSLTFSDACKGVVLSSDLAVGGMRNHLEIYSGKGMIVGNITPNNALQTYFVTPEDLDDFYITEKIQTKNGWSPISVEESLMRGYLGEMQDFMTCAATGEEPQSGFDLAAETTRILYAAYLSAENSRRVDL